MDPINGTPSIALTVGSNARQATYASGSGSTELVFEYTIAQGDLDPDGVSIAADSLIVNGGVIEDYAHNNALLSHAALADNAGHLVDGGSLAGSEVIDLGIYGKLIAPVQVDGNWFYFWDRSGDGVANSSGGALNGGVDYTSRHVLDGIFTEDVNGNANPGTDTTDTYRYATLNGVRLALPTDGDGTADIGYYLTDNGNYTDLAEIWDTHNIGFQSSGTPSGWVDYLYWSATPSNSTHARVDLFDGYVTGGDDFYTAFVALAVL